MSEWINVGDRMPKDHQVVLVWFWREVEVETKRKPKTQRFAGMCLGSLLIMGGKRQWLFDNPPKASE